MKRPGRRHGKATPAMAALLLTACEGGSGGPTAIPPPPAPPPPPAQVASVNVAPDVAATLVGTEASLVAVARDAQGNEISGRSFTWSSSDPVTVEVNAEGVVTGRALGNATITASTSGIAGEARVEVIEEAFVSVAASGVFTCGLMEGGRAYCWGGPGLLVDGSTNEDPNVATPVPVAGGLTFASVASGTGAATCAVTDEGVAYCWGFNGNLELGISTVEICGTVGGMPATCAFEPVQVSQQLQLAWAGSLYKHSCALTEGGIAQCWGFNRGGQVGVPEGDPHPVTPVGTSLTFRSIDGGFNHTCGLAEDGTAYCWGSNAFVKGPDGVFGPSLQPMGTVEGLVFETLASSGWHACASTGPGETWCWGRNDFGQLGASSDDTCGGNPPSPCSLLPLKVKGNLTLRGLTAGFYHNCGLGDDGTAYCWGRNDDGQLGVGSGVGPSSDVPVAVAGFIFASLDAGRFHTCGVTPDGTVYCWGLGTAGQLGNGEFLSTDRPVRVFGEPRS